MDRGGGFVRTLWADSGGAEPGFARGCAFVFRRKTYRESYDNYVVTDFEEDDRAGECGNSVRKAGHAVADGDHD